ncbi:hypothetical protein GGR57DRAFT_484680, partial [Xylariaceae sp. FL1272]
MFSCIWYAVRRVGEVFDEIVNWFPGDETAKSAYPIFRGLTTETIKMRTLPFKILLRYEGFKSLARTFPERAYLPQLNREQGILAMSTFNHKGPFLDTELELFREHRSPILQVAIIGLCVFAFAHYRASSRAYKRLSFPPELEGRKYIYLTTCEQV